MGGGSGCLVFLLPFGNAARTDETKQELECESTCGSVGVFLLMERERRVMCVRASRLCNAKRGSEERGVEQQRQQRQQQHVTQHMTSDRKERHEEEKEKNPNF